MLAECSNWWNNYIWDILLANIGEHIPAPWSIWVKITFKIHRNLKEAMKTRVKWWDGIEHGSIAMTTGYNGEIIVNMWGFTSKIWPILDIPLNCFTSSDPHPDTLFWRSFWHTIWTYVLVCIYIYCIYTNSDILSGIYSDIGSDIISGILSGMCLGPGVADSRKGAGDMMLGSRRSPQEVREWGVSCTFAEI